MGFKPCWICGSNEECYEDCSCAKCLNPEEYEEWKNNCPEQYEAWLDRQRENDE